MPIILSDIRIGLNEPEETALAQAARLLGLPSGSEASIAVSRMSLDARKRDQIRLVYGIRVDLPQGEEQLAAAAAKRLGGNRVRYTEARLPDFTIGSTRTDTPVVVVGFGPAGMFAALTLAEQGYRPIVLERGADMDRRVAAVNAFWETGKFSSDTNVQFGEGGAGTFSDGKLTTRISDSRCEYVLQRLAALGAPAEILTKAKPHIGTDRLRSVVKNLRQRVETLGGQVLFDTKLEKLILRNGRVCAVETNHGELRTEAVLLAIGHSARDTFLSLAAQGAAMEAKPFSVGARIEHLQAEIDRGLYGEYANHPRLPKGEYQLSQRERERGVYTFCMCPGGLVVPSSSEEQGVVTNGMSTFARDGENANAALVVSVSPADFGKGPLDGVAFQQELEQRAYQYGGGGYRAPAQDVGSLLAGTPGLKVGRVTPSYARGVVEADFEKLYPDFVLRMLRQGIRRFGQLLPGFATEDAILTGPETRTSSPVRILRTEGCESLTIGGLYPCGEGAGYAGGIMSAAADGIRVAQALMQKYAPPEQIE